MNLKRPSAAIGGAVLLAVSGFGAGFGAGLIAAPQSVAPISPQQVEAQSLDAVDNDSTSGFSVACNGVTVECIPDYLWTPTPIVPAETATRTPTAIPTATRTATAIPTATRTGTPVVQATPTRTPQPTPTKVTPGTPGLPRTEFAEIAYIPRVNLIIRTSPGKTDTNATAAKAFAGVAYTVFYKRFLADGSIWGCRQDVLDWQTCNQWFAITADLSPVDGILEVYADPKSGPTGR